MELQITEALVIEHLGKVMQLDLECSAVYPIKGCTGYYITDTENVYSFRGNGMGHFADTPELMALTPMKSGTPLLALVTDKHGIRRQFRPARLLRCAIDNIAP